MAERNVEHTSMVQHKMGAMQSAIEMIQDAQQQQHLEDQFANQHEELATVRNDLATLREAVDRYTLAKVEERAQSPSSGGPQEAESLEDVKGRLRKLEEQVQNLHLRERQRGEVNEAVVDLERRVATMEQQNAFMLETTSYDGVFLWKIDDYGRRLKEATMGKRVYIDSPPFYVGFPGYKVRARAYLNGYGLGNGTHLSLLIVVMHGEHDALLPWPFQQKVTFKLIDQSQGQHIIDSFQPSLQPNIASGCPLFVPRAVLNSGEHVKEDVMFVKVTVDTTGIPTF